MSTASSLPLGAAGRCYSGTECIQFHPAPRNHHHEPSSLRSSSYALFDGCYVQFQDWTTTTGSSGDHHQDDDEEEAHHRRWNRGAGTIFASFTKILPQLPPEELEFPRLSLNEYDIKTRPTHRRDTIFFSFNKILNDIAATTDPILPTLSVY